MPRQLDDKPETRLVLAPPAAGSISPQQVRQFLRENQIHTWFEQDVTYALSEVPVDRWNRISTYLHANWPKMSSAHIKRLTRMPIERLDAVLSFVNAHHITNEYTLHALSIATDADLDDFKTFLQNDDTMQQHRFPLIFAHMPKNKWLAFSAFIRHNQFDKNIMDWGMVYAKHPEENWGILFDFVKKENTQAFVSDYVIHKLAEMPPKDSMTYLAFLKTHQVMDWQAKNRLVDIPADKRERFWAFATDHNLVGEVGALAKISDARWDIVTRFILKYPGTSINSLTSLPVEQWDAFECFVSEHQMTDGEWITAFARVPAEMRKNLLIYQQEYNARTFQLYHVSCIPADLWPQFMATIKRHDITDTNVINSFAEADPSEWEELASFIAQKTISNYYVVRALIQASQARYRALLAFVEQFNIHDQDIIGGLAGIPSQQWEDILRLSEPLLQPPLLPEDRSIILSTVYKITKREYRIDREMPIYGEAERQGRIAYALAEIENGRMPQEPDDYSNRLQQILKTPLNQRLNMHHAAREGATAIDVHAEGRDDATTMAMQLFMQLPYDLTQVIGDYEAFIAYLNAFPQVFIRTCAQMVLGLQRADGFAPISADGKITSHGLDMTGREFFARLWDFIHHGTFEGIVGDDALNKERENARIALARNLADAYEEDQVICNPGKIQRIVVGVLQGRLHGVHVDKEVPVDPASSSQITLSLEQEETILTNTVAASLRDFLQTYEPMAHTQQALRTHVNEWLQKERGLQALQIVAYRRQFQTDLNSYLALSDLPEQDADIVTAFTVEQPVQNDMLDSAAQQFNARKKQIQDKFLRYLQTLEESTNRPSTATLCKKLHKDLNAAQDEFFKKLTINTSPTELEQAIMSFRYVCKANVTSADRIMGHGWLYRIIEITLKATLGLFAGVGMILGAVIGRGILSTQDRQAFRQTFFALNETPEQKSLRTFEKQTLEEESEGLLSTRSFQTESDNMIDSLN